MNATEFQAKCLSLHDEVQRGRESIRITKRGHSVAMVDPVKRGTSKSRTNSWAGRAQIVGDIVNSDAADLWEAFRPE